MKKKSKGWMGTDVPKLGREPLHPTTVWNGVRIIKKHSLLAAARQAALLEERMQITIHLFIGKVGAGKSTLARSVAHLMHKELNERYGLRFKYVKWGVKQLVDLEESLKQITTDTIILFDDVAWAKEQEGRKRWAAVQQAIANIRHREVGDVRIVMLFTFQYSRSTDKFIRSQNDFIWLTGMNPEEYSNVSSMMGRGLRRAFQTFYHETLPEAIYTGRWGPMATKEGKKKGERLYEWHKPFAPALLWDGRSLRTIAYPLPQWIDKTCPICGYDHSDDIKQDKEIDDTMEHLQKKWGASHLKTAAGMWLIQHGETPYADTVIKATKSLEKTIVEQGITKAQLIDWFRRGGKRLPEAEHVV